jgi:TniQ
MTTHHTDTTTSAAHATEPHPDRTTPPHPNGTAATGPARADARAATAATGILRLRPIPHETTASYLQRLADTYHTTTTDLLDALAITTATRTGPTAPGNAELHLNHTAQHHLAAFTRTPHNHLAKALPTLAADTGSPCPGPRADAPQPPGAAPEAASTPKHATAAWHLPAPGRQPVRACPTCTRRRTHGATSHALIHPPLHQTLCPTHQHWSLNAQHHLDTSALPELTAAHRDHQRLNHHPNAATALTWATAITTRWYDQQTILATRWQQRLQRLADTNPHITPAGRSWALYARRLVTYPETITLARTLTRPQPPAPTSATGHRPRPGPDPATTDFLTRTAHHLGLARLTPPPHDLLWTFIHQTPGTT